jgi:hypothetical protein
MPGRFNRKLPIGVAVDWRDASGTTTAGYRTHVLSHFGP